MKTEGVTIMSKIYAAGMMHKAYPGTGCVTTGVAAKLKGSIVDEFISPADKDRETVTIGLLGPYQRGCAAVMKAEHSSRKAVMYRTARRVMEGYVYGRRRVLLESFTFAATAEVMPLVGASPVFVDVLPDTYNIDPAKLEAAIHAVKAAGERDAPRNHRRRPVRPAGRLSGAGGDRRGMV